MATPAAAAPKKLLPPPPPTPEFPMKWPEKPILRQHFHPFFVGRFLLQVHPQDFVMYDSFDFLFGIKNPTDQHVQYCLKLGQGKNYAIGLQTLKGDVANNGILKPGEIVQLKMYRCPTGADLSNYKCIDVLHYNWDQEVIISYCILDSQKKIDEALKHNPSERSLTYKAKGSYHQKINTESPEFVYKRGDRNRFENEWRRSIKKQPGDYGYSLMQKYD